MDFIIYMFRSDTFQNLCWLPRKFIVFVLSRDKVILVYLLFLPRSRWWSSLDASSVWAVFFFQAGELCFLTVFILLPVICNLPVTWLGVLFTSLVFCSYSNYFFRLSWSIPGHSDSVMFVSGGVAWLSSLKSSLCWLWQNVATIFQFFRLCRSKNIVLLYLSHDVRLRDCMQWRFEERMHLWTSI